MRKRRTPFRPHPDIYGALSNESERQPGRWVSKDVAACGRVAFPSANQVIPMLNRFMLVFLLTAFTTFPYARTFAQDASIITDSSFLIRFTGVVDPLSAGGLLDTLTLEVDYDSRKLLQSATAIVTRMSGDEEETFYLSGSCSDGWVGFISCEIARFDFYIGILLNNYNFEEVIGFESEETISLIGVTGELFYESNTGEFIELEMVFSEFQSVTSKQIGVWIIP